MDVTSGAALASLSLIVVLVAAGVWHWRRRTSLLHPAPNASTPPDGFEGRLRALHADGRWRDLLRLLDWTLPEWPVASSLIEVSRAIATLEQEIAALPATSLAPIVTARLATQTQSIADILWSLAGRIVAANRDGSTALRDQLAQEEVVLMRLLPAIHEARSDVVELVHADGRAFELRRTEGRFLALAATARELQSPGDPPTPSVPRP